MASREHLERLAGGRLEWNRWRGDTGIAPDLRQADLQQFDLAGMNFADAMLDGCDLEHVDLRGANLERASLVRTSARSARFDEAKLEDAICTGADLRAATFIYADLTRADLSDTWVALADMSKARLDGASLADARAERIILTEATGSGVQFDGCELVHAALRGSSLTGSSFVGADLEATDFAGASLGHADFTRSHGQGAVFAGAELVAARLADTGLTAADFRAANLSKAELDAFDFKSNPLADAQLFGTRISNPIWKFAFTRPSWRGGPRLDPGLFLHPVDDVQGVGPRLRREIADAQYLRTRLADWEQSPTRSAIGRLWGITAGYGQSLGRWLISILVLWVCLGWLLTLGTFARTSYVTHTVNHRSSTQAVVHLGHLDYLEALNLCVNVFTAFGIPGAEPVDVTAKVSVVVALLSGLAMVGALVSILANRFARLS